MKRIQILLLIPLLIWGCKSPKNLIKDGNYDEAVKILVKKLSVNPDKEQNIIYLKQSYKAVNQKDIDRINYLRKTGQPNIWYEVYQHYDKLKNRQDLVKALPSDVLSQIGFKSVDYDNDVIEAKKKAAAYLYAHAQMLLKKEDRQSARQAYDELLKVSKLYNDYKDVDALLRRALVMGTNYVLFKMQNKSGVPLPLSFENELMSICLADLDRTFINYDSKAVQGRNYDYNIVVNITDGNTNMIKTGTL
jgi:tetratricopeptide (TPR) repeat protein